MSVSRPQLIDSYSFDARLVTAAASSWGLCIIVLAYGRPENFRLISISFMCALILFGAVSLRKLPAVALICAIASIVMLAIALRNPSDLLSDVTGSSAHFAVQQAQQDYPFWLQWLGDIRHSFLMVASELPGMGAELLPGIVVGDVSAVSDHLRSAMKISSLTHLTAVSGANCAIVVGATSYLLAAMKASNWLRVSLSLLVLFLFVCLVTPQASVVRAAIMACIVLVVTITGRSATGIPLLGLAVLLMLVINPAWAVDYGFALSVLATGGLLVLSNPIAQRLSRWMPRALAFVIAVPLAAQLVCQPVLVLLTPAWSTYGIPANVLAGFVAPVATIVGLLACILCVALPPVAVVLAWCAWLPASFIAYLATVIAKLPLALIPWSSGVVGFLLAVLLSALIVLLLVSSSRVTRRVSMISLGIFVTCLLASSAVNTMFAYSEVPSGWSLLACDVGQGDALLAQSERQVMLIDTGPAPESLTECLAQAHVSHIDVLVLTHFDHDHVGGTSAVPGPVNKILVSSAETVGDQYFIDSLKELSTDVSVAHAGMSGLLGAEQWQVLWPRSDQADMQTGNQGSTVIKLSGPSVNLLALADLERESQERLLNSPGSRAAIHDIDVVKVAHHGSANQYSDLYDEMSAPVALISVGAGNHYGHPTDKTLSLLSATGSEIERTDQHGWIALYATSDSRQFQVLRER